MTNQGYAMSIQQRRQWHHAGLRARCVLRVAEPIGEDALRAALHGMAARHEMLRTTFQRPPGLRTVYQVVAAAAAVELRRAPDAADGPSLLRADDAVPFEPAAGPVLRAWIGAGGSLVLLSLPALCADSRSLALLAAELVGGSAEAPALQYLDYSEWQGELLAMPDAREGRAYWEGRPASVRLPFEHGGRAYVPVAIPLGDLLADATLRSLAGRCGADVETVLLAAWHALLGRMDGSYGGSVGVVLDGRGPEDLRAVIGPFARVLPVAQPLDDALPFQECVARVGAALAEARRRQEYCALEDSEFAAGFAMEPAIDATLLHFEAPVEPFRVQLTGRGIAVSLVYDASRVDGADATSLADSLRTLLDGAARHPETPLDRLPLTSTDTAHRMREALRGPQRGAAAHGCVHERFAAQARRVPERVALVHEEERLTYAALEARANQLAHLLHDRGVAPEVPVAVCVERSADAIVAMLGVLKAGGACVPLDAALPDERLARMLEASGARLLVAQPRTATRLAVRDVPPVLLGAEADRPTSDPEVHVAPENLAYVLFTSGSTGRPKAVAVEHRNLCAYVDGIRERLGLPDGASYATVTTLAADLGHTAIFPALCGGGCLHVIPQDRISDPTGFADYFQHHAIDMLKIVPSHLAALLDGPRPEHVLPRRLLVLGGEACRWELLERVRALAPQLAILNHYGPTETTVGVLTHAVPAARDPRSATVPLGRPLAGTRLYVLDAGGQPVPEWVPGELYVAGGGVARGYLGDVSGGFVADPHVAGGRMYRTGDWVRVLPGGLVEFLGRRDHQLKIRGYRVELGEIEGVLREHAAVREAVVLARAEGEAVRLLAYVTGEAAAADVKAFLAQRLPEAMVPSAVIPLKTMPLNRNGKVDRDALAAIEAAVPQAVYVAPRTATEETVARVMGEVLGVAQVGVHADFFELGGHSLKATQVVARLCGALGIEVPLRALFDAPTVEGLAGAIEERLAAISQPETEDLARFMAQLDAMSDEEAERLLAEEV